MHSARRRRRRSGAIRRALSLLAFMPIASRMPMYARLLWSLAIDERTPAVRKAVLGGALGYVLLGRDLIPDDIPIVGGIDDLIVAAVAVDLFLEGVPEDLLDEKLAALQIERAAFERDIAQIRRLAPGPVRRGIRRLGAALDVAAGAVHEAGVGPRLRTWITKEDSLA